MTESIKYNVSCDKKKFFRQFIQQEKSSIKLIYTAPMGQYWNSVFFIRIIKVE